MSRALWTFLLLASCQTALASDWKYLGMVSPESGDLVLFYDVDSVQRSGPSVRFWVKSISAAALKKAGTPSSKKATDALVKTVSDKIGSGYVPPLLGSPSFRQQLGDGFPEAMVAIVVMEHNASRVPRLVARFLFEIECGQKMSRVLEGTLFDSKGNPAGTSSGEWTHIAPDTNFAWFSEVICPG
ncbi:hypothetical protein [Anaeromyxobacter dehalogenans]|uniref:Lipoprotein n=1 Tax=Anaeromyxobacter dehalogenans (strain 2CP-C) TaxID=290397 RepID=Q2IIY8_ANADE|nr:hypothetical protein [Anaeromyxobacter dehalogenans]ABC81615.1 hypothetical protein Adeh_1843 [Anaeromyxobacter dehalogenans 2CP-C]